MCLNKNYQKTFDEDLNKKFANTYIFSEYDFNKFVLVLQRSVCPYEYIDDWENLNKTSLPEKEDVYSLLNMVAVFESKGFEKNHILI